MRLPVQSVNVTRSTRAMPSYTGINAAWVGRFGTILREPQPQGPGNLCRDLCKLACPIWVPPDICHDGCTFACTIAGLPPEDPASPPFPFQARPRPVPVFP